MVVNYKAKFSTNGKNTKIIFTFASNKNSFYELIWKKRERT